MQENTALPIQTPIRAPNKIIIAPILQRLHNWIQNNPRVPPIRHMPCPQVKNRTILTITIHIITKRNAHARATDTMEIQNALLRYLSARSQSEERYVRCLEAVVAKRQVLATGIGGFGDFVGFADEAEGGLHVGFESFADCHCCLWY